MKEVIICLEINNKQIHIVEGGNIEIHKLYKAKNALFFIMKKKKQE